MDKKTEVSLHKMYSLAVFSQLIKIHLHRCLSNQVIEIIVVRFRREVSLFWHTVCLEDQTTFIMVERTELIKTKK